MLFLRPRDTSLAVARACGGVNDVVGGVAGVGGVGVVVVLGEVVHAGALPEGGARFGESHAEEHEAVLPGRGGAAVGACPGVVAVVAAL